MMILTNVIFVTLFLQKYQPFSTHKKCSQSQKIVVDVFVALIVLTKLQIHTNNFHKALKYKYCGKIIYLYQSYENTSKLFMKDAKISNVNLVQLFMKVTKISNVNFVKNHLLKLILQRKHKKYSQRLQIFILTLGSNLRKQVKIIHKIFSCQWN